MSISLEHVVVGACGLIVGVGGAVAGLFRSFVQKPDYVRDHKEVGRALIRIEGKIDSLARKVAALTGDPNGSR